MDRNSDRLSPSLDAFQMILSASDDRAASMGILNATGITAKTEALFDEADVRDIERALRDVESSREQIEA
jgi:hypothetical protein